MHIVNYDNPPPIEELRMSKLTKAKENGRFTWEKKYSVAAVYLTCMSIRDTSYKTGVPAATIEIWKKTPWWSQMLEEIKKADHAQLNTQLSRIIRKTLDVIDDRVENGELIVDRNGNQVRVPLPVKEATRIASELIQRKEQVNRRIEEEVVRKETMQETLQALASEFAKWNKGGRSNLPLVEEVEDIDALYDERKEGLQEGSGEVHKPSGSS